MYRAGDFFHEIGARRARVEHMLSWPLERSRRWSAHVTLVPADLTSRCRLGSPSWSGGRGAHVTAVSHGDRAGSNALVGRVRVRVPPPPQSLKATARKRVWPSFFVGCRVSGGGALTEGRGGRDDGSRRLHGTSCRSHRWEPASCGSWSDPSCAPAASGRPPAWCPALCPAARRAAGGCREARSTREGLSRRASQ